MNSLFRPMDGKSTCLAQLLRRPEWSYQRLLETFPDTLTDWGMEYNEQIELQIKYAGYIERQQKEAAKLEQLDAVRIPKQFDYQKITGLRTEAQQRLIRCAPENMGQASRIYGISPSDLSILLIALQKFF